MGLARSGISQRQRTHYAAMTLVIGEARATTVLAVAEVVNDERVTSNFALAWTERRVGPMQSHRRFLDYVIDGDSFYRRHGHDLVSVLGWFVPEEDELAAQRLIGSESPDLDGRTAIAVCPEDGDLLCGLLTARIVEDDVEIQWIDLAYSYYNYESETWQH